MTTTATLPILNHVGGAWVGSSSGETIVDRNPARSDEVLGEATVSTPEDVRQAIDAAARARIRSEWAGSRSSTVACDDDSTHAPPM